MYYHIGANQPNSFTIDKDCNTVILCYCGTDYTTGKSLVNNGITVPWAYNSYTGASFNAYTQGYIIWTGDFKAGEATVNLWAGASSDRGFVIIYG